VAWVGGPRFGRPEGGGGPSRLPPMPRSAVPPGTRQRLIRLRREPPPGRLGAYGLCCFAFATQLGLTGTWSSERTPPRPSPKNGLYCDGNPGISVGSPLCPASEKFST